MTHSRMASTVGFFSFYKLYFCHAKRFSLHLIMVLQVLYELEEKAEVILDERGILFNTCLSNPFHSYLSMRKV